MSAVIALEAEPLRKSADNHVAPAPSTPDIDAAIAGACRKIAPLWPLKHFVAVNPFLGFSGRTFAETCAAMRRVARVDMLMPRAFYRDALAQGVIEEQDLAAALAAAPAADVTPGDSAALRLALAQEPAGRIRPSAVVATVAEVLDTLAQGDRHASRTAFMVDEISKWCATYFDEGQAAWRLPVRSQSPYAAWRAVMRHDRNPETMGIRGFRAAIAGLPEEPKAAIATVVERLGIPARAVEDYMHRALFDIGGWAGYARYLVWESELLRSDRRHAGRVAGHPPVLGLRAVPRAPGCRLQEGVAGGDG